MKIYRPFHIRAFFEALDYILLNQVLDIQQKARDFIRKYINQHLKDQQLEKTTESATLSQSSTASDVTMLTQESTASLMSTQPHDVAMLTQESTASDSDSAIQKSQK